MDSPYEFLTFRKHLVSIDDKCLTISLSGILSYRLAHRSIPKAFVSDISIEGKYVNFTIPRHLAEKIGIQ